MSDDGSGKLLSVKGFGLEVELGAGAPRALAMLFPKTTARRRAMLEMTAEILRKHSAGIALDDAEVLYVTSVLGESEARLLRRQQIQARALVAYEREETKQLPVSDEASAPESAPPDSEAKCAAQKTPEDWISKFWDDAGLVSDEILQEVYARVLASEARAPGTCSLRTLSVLRYLDREAAQDFSKLAPLVFDGHFVPEALELLPKYDVGYSAIANLVESRLLTAPSSNIVQHIRVDPAFLHCGLIVVRMSNARESYQILPLTTAGRELFRVAQFEPRPEYVLEVAAWLRKGRPAMQVHWARAPHLDWTGHAESLTWNAIEP